MREASRLGTKSQNWVVRSEVRNELHVIKTEVEISIKVSEESFQ